MALLSYHATPMPWCGLNPSELLMGRRVRTPVPMTDKLLIPGWSYLKEFRRLDEELKGREQRDFNYRHKAREQPTIADDSEVWITSEAQPVPGKVISLADAPRSYLVDTPSGTLRRNSRHLITKPTEGSNENSTQDPIDQGCQHTVEHPPMDSLRRIITRSQTGTRINPPDRWN